eukprot:scaffold14658_cov26-Prasinocladus_malaysianus.AAC.1
MRRGWSRPRGTGRPGYGTLLTGVACMCWRATLTGCGRLPSVGAIFPSHVDLGLLLMSTITRNALC